jgi:hypothetical protein
MTSCRYPRKLVLQRRISYPHHRSGWGYAMASLDPLLVEDGQECVLLDSIVEDTFYGRIAEAEAAGEIPYRRPWVAFVHAPPDLPAWQDPGKSLRRISQLSVWKDSLPYCRGLLTLSAWLGDQVRQLADVPVLHLKHPTEIPDRKFSFPRFLANPNRRVIQVGWWLRHLCSIGELPVRGLQRTLLQPHLLANGLARFERVIEGERRSRGFPPVAEWGVDVLGWQPNQAYDQLLSENIVFLHLRAASACNTLIECIVRHTPVLVNPLSPVIEYLGERYPFYFQTLDEAAAKAEDFDLLRQAHEYLAALPKEPLTGEMFCRTLAESDFYRGL